MPQITFITPDGRQVSVDSDADNVMEAAREHDIPGIAGDCGGVCSCSTCHVHVDPAWRAKVGEAGEMERDTLSFADEVTPSSRLGCQIALTPDLDGLVVTVASSS